MPGKLILFIIILSLVALFVGMNIEYRSDIRVWFGEKGLLQDVRIVLSFFVLYVAGLLSSIPFSLAYLAKLRVKTKKVISVAKEEKTANKESGKKLFGKKKKSTDSDKPESSENLRRW